MVRQQRRPREMPTSRPRRTGGRCCSRRRWRRCARDPWWWRRYDRQFIQRQLPVRLADRSRWLALRTEICGITSRWLLNAIASNRTCFYCVECVRQCYRKTPCYQLIRVNAPRVCKFSFNGRRFDVHTADTGACPRGRYRLSAGREPSGHATGSGCTRPS